MFGAIGGFIGRVFGADENVGKTVDMIRDGVDKLILTDEERLDYGQKGADLYLRYLEVTRDGGHLARRFIGITVTFVWALFAMTTGALMMLSIWVAGFGDVAVALTEFGIKFVLPSFGGVMLFYFGHRLVK